MISYSTAALRLSSFLLASAASIVDIKPPAEPVRGGQVIDPSYHACSIEFSSFFHYSGNSTYKNPLNDNLIRNLREIAKVPLHVRVGGGSQNRVTWIPDQVEGHIGYYKPDADKAYNTTVGPNFVESFAFWPKDTQWIIGLPVENRGTFEYLNTTKELGKFVADHLSDNLYALEIGNEWSSYGQPANWTVDGFVDLWLKYAYPTAEFATGETNSLSGHGKKGVSDMYAATLWMIDYVLYAAQTDISRLYMHQGTGWKYSAWNPVTAFGYPSGVLGTYYSYLFTHTALAGGGKQVEIISESKHLVVYGIYGRGRRGQQHIESFVAVNLEEWKTTFPGRGPDRNDTIVNLALPKHVVSKDTKVARLTGPGTDVRWGITFAGQGVDAVGKLNGTKLYEKVKDGRVSLAAGEAILIML